MSTDEIARRFAAESTFCPADTYAVLKVLSGVLGDFMANGCTVKLEGMGTFYYTVSAVGNGMGAPEKVTAAQITDVCVRFIPEKHATSNRQVISRSLVSDNIFWEEWSEKNSPPPVHPEAVAAEKRAKTYNLIHVPCLHRYSSGPCLCLDNQ